MTDTPFIAIGNEQLGTRLPSVIACPFCQQEHEVQCSSDNPANRNNLFTLQFYKCGEKTYLAGINRQQIISH